MKPNIPIISIIPIPIIISPIHSPIIFIIIILPPTSIIPISKSPFFHKSISITILNTIPIIINYNQLNK